MALASVFVKAKPLTPARFNLLDTVGVQQGGPHVGMEGVNYESEFCGVARTFSPMCVTADVGSISVSVDDAREATITSTGLPDGTYTIVWGDGDPDTTGEAEQLNEAHTYAADGTYTIEVYGEGDEGVSATVDVDVTDNETSGPFDSDAFETKVADDGITTVLGSPITIYHLFQCRLVGGADDGAARAVRSLDLGASRAVEEAFQTVFATGAVDITPSGTAVDIVKGLALLEEYAGENYGGRPVIHMTRAAATLLIARNAIIQVGSQLETVLGSLVVAGAGYNAQLAQPSAPAAGAGWMYVTGEVNIWEGHTATSGIIMADPYDNEFQALAERTYVPTYECIHAAVEVTETAI